MAKEQEFISSVLTLIGSIDHEEVQGCSISIVPDQLKTSNEDAYMPKVVSMGPLYRGTRRDLLLMEEIKSRCMASLLHRNDELRTCTVDKRTDKMTDLLRLCSTAMFKSDNLVRSCYVDHIKLDVYELAKIMLVDGCFLLELLISASEESNHKLPKSCLDPPGPRAVFGKMEDVLSDLIMSENQIPFHILVTLSQRLFGEDSVININDLGKSLFGYSWDSTSSHESGSSTGTNLAHILELVHSFVPGDIEVKHSDQRKKAPLSNTTGESEKEIQESQHHTCISVFDRELCATRLQAAGVTIKRRLRKQASAGDNSTFDFDITFSISSLSGILEIPPLHITKTTKAKWRNFIAWEHHKNHWKKTKNHICCKSKFTSSALFFNGLIASTLDVQLLKDRKVVVDHLNMNNEQLVTFFRNIAKGVDHGIIDSGYVEMCDELNSYSQANCAIRISKEVWYYVRWSVLKLYKYFMQNYHLVISVGIILTVVQTVYAILAFHLQ